MIKPNTIIVDKDYIPVNLDFLIGGLSERIALNFGITNANVKVTRRLSYGFDLRYSFLRNGVEEIATDTIYEEKPTHRDVAKEFFYDVLRRLNYSIWVRIGSGKYKGSIGLWSPQHVTLGTDIQGSNVTIPSPAAKNLTLLEGTDHTQTLVFESMDFTTEDKFGNTNEINDIIVFVTDGKIQFGIYLENDTLNKRIVLKSIGGKDSVVKVYLKPERDMMNVSKMPSSSITRKILMAQLNSD